MLENMTYPKTSFVGKVQLTLQGFKGHSRLLGHGFHVHCLIRLQSDHKLIPTTLAIKNVSRNIPELNTHFGLALIQSWNGRECRME